MMRRYLVLGLAAALSTNVSYAVYISCDDWADRGTPDWSYRYLSYLLVKNPGAGEIFLSAMPIGTEDCFDYASEYSGTGRAEYYTEAIKDKARPTTGKHPRFFERKFDDNIAVSVGGHIQFRAAYGNNDLVGENDDVSGGVRSSGVNQPDLAIPLEQRHY